MGPEEEIVAKMKDLYTLGLRTDHLVTFAHPNINVLLVLHATSLNFYHQHLRHIDMATPLF